MNKLIVIVLFINFLLSDTYSNSCIVSTNNREIYRNNFTFHETIQSDNFAIHYTTSDVDSQLVNGQWFNLQSNITYAQSILTHAEAALVKFLDDGWENIPPDCDESITDEESPHHCINFGGNSLYDIYIANDAAGMVVPENPYNVYPYTGGYTSYMKISTLLNEYDELPSWSYHVVAHELHHAIQLRYGYSVSGNPGNYMFNGWFFEQTATYMENVIYPESIHLRTMLGNCNIVTPLTFPEYDIDYPSEIYPYRSAIWQKFLVESTGDSSIVRYIWEGYGLEYAEGDIVSLFPIYNSAIEQATDNSMSLSDAYSDYSEWRYFTGSRSIPNMYFNEALTYCTASTSSDFENSFILPSNKGSSKYINFPSEDMSLVIATDFIEDISFFHLRIDQENEIHLIELEPENNSIYFNIFSNDNNVLLVNSNYDSYNSFDITFSISSGELIDMGDVNFDNQINILDVVQLIELILENEYILQGDLNYDNQLNIIDVVQLVNMILNQ